jgi:hypothetical protein
MDANLGQGVFLAYALLLSVVSGVVNALVIWRTRPKQP